MPIALLRKVFSDTEEYGKKMRSVEYCVYHCGRCEPIVDHERKEVIFLRPQTIYDLIRLRSLCPLEKEDPYAITHLKVHEVWNEELEEYRNIIRAIAEHCFGEDGRKAVDLHLELDEKSHILNVVFRRIPTILTKGIKGVTPWEDRWLQKANVVRKYLKDPPQLLRCLSGRNRDIFTHNLTRLLKMKLSDIIPEMVSYKEEIANKTINSLVNEYGEKELKWLKEITKLFKDSC